MKNRTLRLIVFTAGVMAMAVAVSRGGVVGSAHDFSMESWNTSGQICLPCHTPHHALSTLVPLWNHETTVAAFIPYDSPTMDATVPVPGDSSRACLSCHDGTVALDSFGGNTAGSEFIPDDANLGTDLSDDHPISFVYDTTLAGDDGELFDPSVKTVPAIAGSPTIQDGLLIADKLECASCHDVHANKGDAESNEAMLIVDNAASALCLTCHDK